MAGVTAASETVSASAFPINWGALAVTISYPVLAHLAALMHWPLLQAGALLMLGAVILLPRRIAWVATVVLLVLMSAVLTLPMLPLPMLTGLDGVVTPSVGQMERGTRLLAFLVPVMVHGLVGWVFLRSLLPGREPLVTAIGRRARGTLPPPMQRYTRQVTAVWAALFGCLLLLSIVLPFVSVVLWSWCTNVLNYVLITLLMGTEFAWRRRMFPSHDHPSFRNYLRIVLQADVRQL